VNATEVGCTVPVPDGTIPLDRPPVNESWVDRPDAVMDNPGYRIRTNTDGYRTGVNPGDPKQGERIVVIGDSLTWGVGVNRSDLFVNVLEQRLSTNRTPVTVVPAAVMGWGMREYYGALRRTVMEYRPERVIIAIEPRDEIAEGTIAEWKKEFDEQLPQDLSRGERNERRNELIQERMIQKLEQRSFRESGIRRNMARIHAFLDAEDVPHSFVLIDEFDLDAYSFIRGKQFTTGPLARWADSCGMELYGLPERIREQDRERYTYLPRDWHYNSYGHRILAEHLLDIIGR